MITASPQWKRLGSGEQARGAALMCLYGAGESGKTRLAACAARACPEWFGERMVYIAVDPEAASLGPVLPEDKKNLEVIVLNLGADVFQQMDSIYKYDWLKEGFKTIITDTMTVFSQAMLSQLTNSGRFSDKHIDLGNGIKQPMQGDFLAASTLLFSLLRRQQESGMNHLTLFHEQEVRPDSGQPGEPIGGPATTGKASVRSLINWYNTALHLVRRQKKRTDLTKPVEYERVVYTTGHGIWQGKLRTSALVNPISEIAMDPDPVNVWRTLQKD